MDLNAVARLRERLNALPAVPIEKAADLCGVSTKTIRRNIHRFEVIRRGPYRHVFLTLRSIEKFLAEQQYSPTKDFDITQSTD